MKKVLLVIGCLLVLLIAISYSNLLRLKKNLQFNYRITSISLRDILNGVLNLKIRLTTTNNSNVHILIENCRIDIYYKNSKISTIKKNNLIVVPGVTNNDFDTKIFLGKEAGELLNIFTNEKSDENSSKIPFDIRFKGRVFSLPIRFKTKVFYER